MCRCFHIRVRPAWALAAVLGILVLAAPSLAGITFEKTYGGLLVDRGRSVQQTSDGGYIVAGIADWGGDSARRLCLIKTDSLGDTLWFRVYGSDSLLHSGESVQQTLDGGYIVVGGTEPIPYEPWDVYLLKTDLQGEVEWAKTYGYDGHDVGNHVQQTTDGGYIVVGGTLLALLHQVYLFKTNASGDMTWSMTYGAPDDATGYCVQQTSDGGYIVTGEVCGNPGPNEVLLIKINPAGMPEWHMTYDMTPELDEGCSVEQTTDGGYVIAGRSFSFSGSNQIILIKTDQLGGELWSRLYGPSMFANEGRSVRQTFDGGYVIAGCTELFGPGARDVYLLRTDSLGTVLWDTTFGTSGWDSGWSVQLTADSGYVIAGDAEYFGGETALDVYLIKTNERGQIVPVRDAAVVRIELPPDTVFTDTSYQVRARVKNMGNTLDTFSVIATIDGYSDTYFVEGLGSGLSIDVSFRDWRVPPDDSSTYIMRVCADTDDDLDSTNDCKRKTIFAYSPTGIEEDLNHRPLTAGFRLSQNKPNPFNHSTSIRYSLPVACTVSLEVYDITGRLLETLLDGHSVPGIYQADWNGKDVSAGIYFCRLEAGEFIRTVKMTLVR